MFILWIFLGAGALVGIGMVYLSLRGEDGAFEGFF
jgi:hypothetical protein